MKSSISKYTLFEYLAGRSNPLERQLAEDWIKKQENSDMFYQWLLEYETRSPQYIPDSENAVAQLLERVQENLDIKKSEKEIRDNYYEQSAGKNGFRKTWLIAASILLVGSCGWLFREPIQYKTYQTGYGQTTNIYLEDGTRVALNSNSSLKVPRFGFDNNVRNVMLVGEGEFTVSHTIDHKRFVVKTSDTFQVEVLGTKFSVFARTRGTKVELLHGSVRIDYDNGEQRKEVMLEPGDLAILDRNGEVNLKKNQDSKTFAAWKEKRYVFNETPAKEIFEMIEENFGKHVDIPNTEVLERTITGNFKTKNADELIKTISEVLDLKVQISGDSISLVTN